MIKKIHIEKKHNLCFESYYYMFTSIKDLLQYLKNTPYNKVFKNERYRRSIEIDDYGKRFTKTNSYEEAMDLLLHGWKEGTTQLLRKIKPVQNKTKRKTVYNVQGYQCSVPRYLNGMPDSMIYTQKVAQKQKVIKLYKSIAYPYHVEAESILQESRKVLELVQNLEAQGYRVELYAFSGLHESNYARDGRSRCLFILSSVCIKKASQRLNVKQISFPIMHPSFFRRIIFSFIEHVEECPRGWECTYGRVIDVKKEEHKSLLREQLKGCYVIPATVEEEHITDIEQYKL